MKKRFTHPLLEAKRARQSKQTATLAMRQAAGMSKSERKRLAALTTVAEDYGVGEVAKKVQLRLDLSGWYQPLLSQPVIVPTSMWRTPLMTNSLSLRAESTISTDKLEALRNTTPRRITAHIPDMVEVITGWRGWSLRSGLLGALGTDAIWPAKQLLRAACKNGSNESHLAPEWNCACGIWAFKDLDRLAAAIGTSYSAVKVIGSVSLWGKVIETENGYRAQYAYPSELWLLDNSLEELGLIYDVPVRTV